MIITLILQMSDFSLFILNMSRLLLPQELCICASLVFSLLTSKLHKANILMLSCHVTNYPQI